VSKAVDTFAQIFTYIVWGGAIIFAIGVVWKMSKGLFE